MSAFRPGRVEAPALAAVWVREWTVFKYYWRTRTFAAIVEDKCVRQPERPVA